MKKTIALFALCILLVVPAAFAAPRDGDMSKERMEKEMSDTWLEAKLATTIALNNHLSVFDIDSEVRSKTAYLSGSVGTDVEKDLAEQLALSIDGIDKVENNIAIDPAASKQRTSEGSKMSFGQRIGDLTTTASIKTKFLANNNISGMSVNVDTKNGIVTLQGDVASEEAKELAGKIAENTEGVQQVTNNLTVNPQMTKN